MQTLKHLAYPTTFKYRLLLSLASILLYSLSMPGSPLPLLAWITIVPIALAINNASPWRSAFLFYLATTGSILSVMWWLMPAIIDFTQLNQYLAFLVLLVFGLILAIPYALIGWLVAYKQWLN